MQWSDEAEELSNTPFHSKWVCDGLAMCLLQECDRPRSQERRSSAVMQTGQHPRESGWDTINTQWSSRHEFRSGNNPLDNCPLQCTSTQLNFVLSLLVTRKVALTSKICFPLGRYCYFSDLAYYWQILISQSYCCLSFDMSTSFIQESCLILLICGTLTVGSFIVMILRRTITSQHFTGTQYHVLK